MGNHCTHAPTDHYWEVNVRSWTPDHVYSWLSTVDKAELKAAATIFKKHKITGADLISISMDTEQSNKRLQNMHVTIGDRLHLKQAVQALLHPNFETKFESISKPVTVSPLKTVYKKAPLTPNNNTNNNCDNNLVTANDHFVLNDYNLDTISDCETETDEPSALKPPKLAPFVQPVKCAGNSLSKIKGIITNNHNHNNNGFVMLNEEDSCDNLQFTNMASPASDASPTCSSSYNKGNGCPWRHVEDTYNKSNAPSFPVGRRPMLLNLPSHKSIRDYNMSNESDDDEPDNDAFVMNDYNVDIINRNLNDNDAEKNEMEYSQSQSEQGYYAYFEEIEQYDEDDYEPKIKALTTAHTASLYMLQTAKEYLLSGYLRTHGVNIHKVMYIPHAIIQVILLFFDDSYMHFNIKVTDFFSKLNGFNNHKLQTDPFKFHLNMDHKIKLSPTLTRKIIDRHNLNEIELSLECQELPIKIDNCMVLINILCICHEIKYQKMDLFMFGTDLIGDDLSYNLLNKSGLKMIIPQRDIENLKELQFKINATVLDIEYDPSYENYGIVPAYNKSLKMSTNIAYEWCLNKRVLDIMENDKFKQRFYSNHFDYEHFCLSGYKHDNGQLILLLNLLRLQSEIASIDCHTFMQIKNNTQIVWSQHSDVHMDTKYNNSFKWKLKRHETNELFRISNSKLSNEDKSSNISLNIQINVLKVNEKKLNTPLDIYNQLNMIDYE